MHISENNILNKLFIISTYLIYKKRRKLDAFENKL